jgi:hypothetical protein
VSGEKLDAVVVGHDPRGALARVFGTPYSDKPWWPWLMSSGAMPAEVVTVPVPVDPGR